ncbi:hypothetical protein [Pedobacter deserti]|uniref:hypothetical protein n=1 Tax=Pedobacter deserti TaxID=2817382 RepID=UPI00210E9B02|nr:hypothetical protein [Pedobacter sp. SYSU D00382]
MHWSRSFLLGLCLSLSAFSSLSAQSFSEWFRQKKTQRKYLVEQIAALQMYLGYAKKGYEIAGQGWSAVRRITEGEFKLHELFIFGLSAVSPSVRNDSRIAEIITLQVSVLKSFSGLVDRDGFTGDQLAYVLEVKAGVLEECLNDLSELFLAVTAGKAEMSDDERLARIGAVHEAMLEKSAFCQDFVSGARMLLNQQRLESHMLEKLRRYHE